VNKAAIPFNLSLDPEAFDSVPGSKHMLRYLSDVESIFSDKQTVAEILAQDDPLIYEYWEIPNESSSSALSFGLTRILPGTVGQEYHMTRGHFHTIEEDGDELYFVLQGRGVILLQTRESENRALEMTTGSLCYVPAGWGHRSVNCGAADLVFVSIWPLTVGHDYEVVEQGGFPQLVVRGSDGPMVIGNPNFLDYKAIIGSRSLSK
jgi:glucose-6-phosphate isomerase